MHLPWCVFHIIISGNILINSNRFPHLSFVGCNIILLNDCITVYNFEDIHNSILPPPRKNRKIETIEKHINSLRNIMFHNNRVYWFLLFSILLCSDKFIKSWTGNEPIFLYQFFNPYKMKNYLIIFQFKWNVSS